MMTNDYQRPPIRVALMGLGRAMFADHFPVFRDHPALFNVVAACDPAKERRDIVKASFPHCRMFRRLDDMLDEHDIDLVDIATCTGDHVDHALMALKSGRWTLIETPMATTLDEAQVLRGAAKAAKNKLLVMQRGMFSADYLLAKQVMSDPRIGGIHSIRIASEDFVRRDDWQAIKRMAGGAAYYAMPDLILQALKLLPVPPIQMWSELKRIASVGDCEDYVHVNLRTRTYITAEIEYNGGILPSCGLGYSFRILGERGSFVVKPGALTGRLVCIDPAFQFPRRRSSVRVPSLTDMHEKVPTKEFEISLSKGTLHGQSAFWRAVYDTIRIAKPFPFSLEDSIETVKFAQLMKKSSPFGK